MVGCGAVSILGLSDFQTKLTQYSIVFMGHKSVLFRVDFMTANLIGVANQMTARTMKSEFEMRAFCFQEATITVSQKTALVHLTNLACGLAGQNSKSATVTFQHKTVRFQHSTVTFQHPIATQPQHSSDHNYPRDSHDHSPCRCTTTEPVSDKLELGTFRLF